MAGALHPQTRPFDRRTEPVDAVHRLYLEQYGRAEGLPALFLHGGPGSGCQPGHARLFDPARFRAVLLDLTLESVVPTWSPAATSFFNVQEDASTLLGSATEFDGELVTLEWE